MRNKQDITVLEFEAANDGKMNAQAEPAGDRANEVEPRPNLAGTSSEPRRNLDGTKQGEAIRNTFSKLAPHRKRGQEGNEDERLVTATRVVAVAVDVVGIVASGDV